MGPVILMLGKNMKWHNDEFWLSDESSDVDLATVHSLLSTTYWASARPKERTERAAEKSVCFSLKLGACRA